MPAVGRRYGEVRVSGGRPHGPVSMHRRPRALRRFHRLPGRRGRGQAGVHVLQNHKSAPRRTGGRSAAVGERPLICSSSPRHTLTLLIHIHAPTTTRIYAAIRTPTYARVPEYSSEERRRRRRSGGGGREEDYMTPTATFTRCPTVHNAINSALS